MAEIDKASLDANYATWLEERGNGLKDVDPWLIYSIEQFIRPFDVSDSEVLESITDGADDGGIDAVFIFANQGTLITDASDVEAKSVSKLQVVIFQVKKS